MATEDKLEVQKMSECKSVIAEPKELIRTMPSEDKHLEEKEKLEAEIGRSLSVVKIKEVHKQIEDIEKLRKQASIKSICERITFCLEISKALAVELVEIGKDKHYEKSFGLKLIDSDSTKRFLDSIKAMYESILFDLQKTIDVKKEDFDRLFPKIEFNFSTYESIAPNMNCLDIQLIDMRNYCLRLL